MNKQLLSSLSLPEDLKKLNIDEQTLLCHEIRHKLLTTVSKNGGHLSSNLGVVELTVALHYVFDSPHDKIIFDVGHQSYTHKILTGRYNEFSTLRKLGGICGFSKPKESIHDPVVSGHSSTSISSALGIAEAMKLKGDDHHAIAVIGDGALTGGLAFEGLNIAGKSKANIIVIVNYNEMSISKNIGGMAEYLSKLRTKKSYKIVKRAARDAVSSVPILGEPIRSSISIVMDIIKSSLFNSTLFEEFGFEYIGPVDGHDLSALEEALSTAKSMEGPVLVQVNTVKGKGYQPAETNPGEYHSVSGFDLKTGKKPESGPGFSDMFGKALLSMAEKDERICAITAAMKYGTGLNHFAKKFPKRFFDVGIAEEHAVTFAAGLSTAGMLPVFAVYSSFLQRSYDQLVHDMSIAGLHCVFAVLNCGIVGEDGETHQGLLDISFLRSIPNVKIYSPSCYDDVEYCLKNALYNDSGMVFIRMPKGTQKACNAVGSDHTHIERSKDRLLISYGREADIVSSAAEKLNASMLKLLNVYPIKDEIYDIISEYKNAYFFEETFYEGSIGQKLESRCKNLKAFAINGFVQHMTVCEALKLYSLDEEGIIKIITEENGNAET